MVKRREFTLRIENYLPLISKISLEHWKRLPNQTKLFIDPEDMLQDGAIFVKTHLMPKFDFKYKAKFSTYIFEALHRFYNGYTESLTCEKRFKKLRVLKELAMREEYKRELYTLGIEAYESMVKLYEGASENLQRYMENWFFSPEGPSKTVTTGKDFMRAKKELLRLLPEYGITSKDCHDLVMATRMGVFEAFEETCMTRR